MHNFKENGEIQNKGDVEMIKKEILDLMMMRDFKEQELLIERILNNVENE